MAKRVAYVGLGAVGIALLLAATPMGVGAQQTIRNVATDITEILGAAPSATNPLPVRITNGTSYASDDVAEGTASSGNPVPVGSLVESSPAGMTVLDDGDRGTVSAEIDRFLHVRSVALGDIAQERTTNTDGASTAFASGLAAPGASVRHYLTSCTFSNTSASAITVDLRDGAAGSVLWSGPVPGSTSGAHIIFPTPLKFTANTAVAFDASAATTTLTIACSGFKSKAG
jgi:hypothetical protein